MHPNPIYRKAGRETNIAFARERSFGVLAVNSLQTPLISHIPFQLSEDGAHLEAHLVRVNPIVKLLKYPVEAVVAISGGDSYISPDWYGIENQVPTWNYIAVHLRGTLSKLDQIELRGILDRLSANMEQRLKPKKPWTTDKMDEDVFATMSMQIVPVAMDVHDIDGTWKFSQNKPADAIIGAMNGARMAQIGSEVDTLVKQMDLNI